MADGRHFENSFITISQPEIIRFQRHLVGFGYISTNDYSINAKFCKIKQNHVLTQVVWPKYQISKTQDGGWPPFWKMALSPYLSRELSDFDQIWYTDANFHSEHGKLTKIEIFQIQHGGWTPYWKSFFGYISAPYWLINAKFGTEMTNHVQI